MILLICVLSVFDIIYTIRYDVAKYEAVKVEKSVDIRHGHGVNNERHRFL